MTVAVSVVVAGWRLDHRPCHCHFALFPSSGVIFLKASCQLIVVSFHPAAAAATTAATAAAAVAIIVVHQQTTRACEVQQFSRFGVWFLRGRLQFSYVFAIFI